MIICSSRAMWHKCWQHTINYKQGFTFLIISNSITLHSDIKSFHWDEEDWEWVSMSIVTGREKLQVKPSHLSFDIYVCTLLMAFSESWKKVKSSLAKRKKEYLKKITIYTYHVQYKNTAKFSIIERKSVKVTFKAFRCKVVHGTSLVV